MQFTSQHVFWIICRYPKETTMAPRVSPYPSLHCSLNLFHCHWVGQGDRKGIHMFCQISAPSPHDIAKCWLSNSSIFLNTDISGLSVVQFREVNSLLHLERGSEIKNITAHYLSSAQANFRWNREKKKTLGKHYVWKWVRGRHLAGTLYFPSLVLCDLSCSNFIFLI